MKQSVEKALFVILLAGVAVVIVLSVYAHSWRWLLSAGLVLGIAGFLHMDIAGVFSGATSPMTGLPTPASFQDKLFACRKTGLCLIIAGLVLQLASIWVW